jgi:hypothetical protein
MTSRRILVEAIALVLAGSRGVRVPGQEARALPAKASCGRHGVSTLECNAWAFRLAVYCHASPREDGLAIRTDRKSHPGGRHRRQPLETLVLIVSNSDDATEVA